MAFRECAGGGMRATKIRMKKIETWGRSPDMKSAVRVLIVVEEPKQDRLLNGSAHGNVGRKYRNRHKSIGT
jgi:hypothetical protein